MKIRFQKLADPLDSKTLSMTVTHESWPEIMDEFVAFLNAAGFKIGRDQIEDWVCIASETLPE